MLYLKCIYLIEIHAFIDYKERDREMLGLNP